MPSVLPMPPTVAPSLIPGFSLPTAATALLGVLIAHLGSKTYESIKRKLKLRAIESLASPYLMEYMARRDPDPLIRAAAARHLSNPRTIRQLLDNERHSVVRSALIGQLPTQELRNLYAREHGNRVAKQELLQHVFDQQTIFECLRHETDPTIATVQMLRLTDPRYVDLLRQHPLAAVKEWATRILPERLRMRGEMEENPDKILDALLSFPKLTPQMQRLLAWVTVPQIFYELILQHPDSEVKAIALRSIAAQRPRLLCKLTTDERVRFELRVAALSLCHQQDPGLALKLVETDRDPRMRAQALSLLSGHPNLDELLERRAQAETDTGVLLQIVQLTRRVGLLRKLQQRLNAMPLAAPVKALVTDRLRALEEAPHV